MITKEKISPLLEAVVKDNTTLKFPAYAIEKELLAMFMEKIEFDYFTIQCFKKLKRDYGFVFGHIFLTTIELKMKLRERDIQSLSDEQYREELEEFINTLENLYVTRIEKQSPDGEMLSVMV